jgi:hypothetical protein
VLENIDHPELSLEMRIEPIQGEVEYIDALHFLRLTSLFDCQPYPESEARMVDKLFNRTILENKNSP